MADWQAQIPGGAYFNDVEEATLRERQIPGFQYINETQQTAGAVDYAWNFQLQFGKSL